MASAEADAGWPPGRYLLLDHTGLLHPGADPVAVASPALTVDGRHPSPRPLSADRVAALLDATRRADHPCWSRRWRPLDPPEPPETAVDLDARLVARLPLVLGPAIGGFAAASMRGPVRLEGAHLDALARFARPATAGTAGDPAESRWTRLVAELLGAELLVPVERVEGSADAGARARHRARARQRLARRRIGGPDSLPRDDRIPVVGLVSSLSDFPLSLGMVLAYADASSRLSDRYSFHLAYATPGELARCTRPAVWLFSDYLWTERRNRRLAEALAQAPAPGLRVFGGPQVPRPAEAGPWFVDVGADVAVHGEGEVTLEEILHRLRTEDLGSSEAVADRLAGVAGCSVPGTSVDRGERPRIADLDRLPSPFLTGWFDDLRGDVFFSAVLETNRGCPYGCTFCDWGSATRSRIRSFDLARVQDEIDWIASAGFEHLLIADANFGILERDREIATHLVAARKRHGAPQVVGTNYAKNPKRHVVDIVADLVAGGFTTVGQVALQTTDRETLRAVDRANIAPESYDELLAAFDDLGLPIQTDLMMGLPGATVEAFRRDLQHVIDSDVHAIVARTKVLRNAPMNDPDHRRELRIRTAGDEFVSGSASFDEDDLDRMIRDHAAFFAADDLGVLRVVLRFARHRSDRDELDVLLDLAHLAEDERDRFPRLWWVLTTLARWAVEPVAWAEMLDEVRDGLVTGLGLAADSALEAALTAQRALLPRTGRTFPDRVELDHDVAAWWSELKRVRRSGGRWSDVADLRTFGPGELVVDDPNRVCDLAMGDLALMGRAPAWDLASDLSRPSPTGLLVTTG